MKWSMEEKSKFKSAVEEANKILEAISYYDLKESMISTDAVIKYLEKQYSIKIKTFRMGFSSLNKKMKHLGSIMEIYNNDVEIYLNSEKDLDFQRFSLVYILGLLINKKEYLNDGKRHAVLGTYENYDIKKNRKEKQKKYNTIDELEANIFALKLLMPEKRLKKMSQNYQKTEVLADLFGVSKNAVLSAQKLNIEMGN